MAININDGFQIGSSAPVDNRMTVADLTARDALNSVIRYAGLKVYVESESKFYSLVGGIADINWVEDAGGSGSTIDPIVAALIFG